MCLKQNKVNYKHHYVTLGLYLTVNKHNQQKLILQSNIIGTNKFTK